MLPVEYFYHVSVNVCRLSSFSLFKYGRRTFIMSSNVLNTINIMIKYSNGVDTTMRHTLYLKLFRLLGMYRSSGRAPIVKSMHDFCNTAQNGKAFA